MRTVEEIRADIDACYANLSHLVQVNAKWTNELPNIDPDKRPVGYSNQIEGIRQQETAFASESRRLVSLSAEEWVSSIGPLELIDLEYLKEVLKSASEVIKKEIKLMQESSEKEETVLF